MKPPSKPNIILINCDDLGYGDLGCYGSELNRTPAIDRLAAEGLRLTDFYMASPVCSPSRGAMMTGCYPPRIGFADFEGRPVLFPGQSVGLNPDEMTLARLLKQGGYATKMVGKWHCGDQKEFLPTRHGFDSYYGLPYSNDMGRQVPDDPYPPLPLLRDEAVIQEQPEQGGLTERYVEESVRFLRDHRDKPFFLYFSHLYVHLPLYVPDRFLRESKNGRYGAAVACVDWALDALMTELRALGLDENTLVIFTSDNGSRCRGEGGSNAPLRGTKATTWEGGQRVPCILRWPARIPAGTVCEGLSASLDFLPTFAALAGVPMPQDRRIDGHDLSPMLFSGQAADTPRETFFYYKGTSLNAVRKGTWKLHLLKDGKPVQELYDLENDVEESRSVSNEYPAIVEDLLQEAAACRIDLGDSATGVTGRNLRPCGRVENPVTLTRYQPGHPYILAEYDLKERG